MHSLLRVLHVLVVALWFGSVTFFSVAGLLIFNSLTEVSALPAESRPLWLPVPREFETSSPGEGFPNPMRLEQGSRAAGVAVSRIFPVYYAMQLGCAVVAVLTALALARSEEGGTHGWRVALCILALVTVLGGWWLEGQVAALRVPRNERTDQVLTTPSPSAELVAEARDARATFGRWHGFSLLQNFVTLGLVTGITLLIPALGRKAAPEIRRLGS